LAADRTWTLSLPAALTFPGKTITGGAYASASATLFTFTTGTVGTAVTGVTQVANTNNTTISTTAYADAAAAAAVASVAPIGATYITQTANGTLTNEQALGLLATGIMKSTTTTGVVSIAAQGTDYWAPGGTDVALADGGTGASLTDPNADRIMFWDDSAGQVTWLTPGTGLTITGTTMTASGTGGTFVETEIDFGTTNRTQRTFTITDAGVSATSKIVISISGNTATGRNADEIEMEVFYYYATPGTGTFSLFVKSLEGPVVGTYKLFYTYG
jgi:hypothetical protein